MGYNTSLFIHQELESLGYKGERIIGGGSFSTVVRGVRQLDKKRVAIKVLKKKHLNAMERRKIELECEAMKTIPHECVIKLLDRQETERYLYLVLEYCHGGDLLAYMQFRKTLLEGEAFVLFQQLTTAIELAHKTGFVHRDIKLENLLLCEDGSLRVGDWGFACKYDKDSYLRDFPGSLFYASPEIVKGEPYHGPESDVWSMGVTLFALVSGCIPFFASSPTGIMDKIVSAPIPIHPTFSNKLKDLIMHMLDRDPQTRYDVAQIKAHPWYSNYEAILNQKANTTNIGYEPKKTFERATSIAVMVPTTKTTLTTTTTTTTTPPRTLTTTTTPTTPTQDKKKMNTRSISTFFLPASIAPSSSPTTKPTTTTTTTTTDNKKKTWSSKLRRMLHDPKVFPLMGLVGAKE